MTPMSDLSARLKRDVAFHRAAQLLADATRCQQGQSPQNLSAMPPLEREWFTQTARQLIEIFERLTENREPDAVLDQREADARRVAAALEQAREWQLSIERQRGHLTAAERGHDMGSWHGSGEEIAAGRERAVCDRCRREVALDLNRDPVLAGAALTEGCLVAAETETR